MTENTEATAPDWRAEIKAANAKRRELMERLGLSIASTFIPWSQSRNKGEKNPSLNYRVELRRAAPAPNVPPYSVILETDYSMGMGHCPAYKAPVAKMGNRNSVMRDKCIRWECEHGKTANYLEGLDTITPKGGPAILPDPLDVMDSLLLDVGVIDCASFEEWARDLGYDPDSRKAEAIYRVCLETALKMRAALGDATLTELLLAFAGY